MSFYRPPEIEAIRNEIRSSTKKETDKNALRYQLARNPNKDLFRVKTADRWINEEQKTPQARQLLGTLWFEHELCILFADTNVGKSILAVQIGYCLAKRCGMEPFGSQVDETLKVLYVDFELNSAQFSSRYFDKTGGALHFGENFFRAEFNPSGDDPLMYDDYAEYVQERINGMLISTQAQVLIIDNITCMGTSTQTAGNALLLMKALKALKTKYNLSVLVLAHTPKRKPNNPVTINDLQGSKMLINFADSAFSIGQSSREAPLRYLKQIKQRNTGSDYGAEHVCLFRIGKQHSFLKFGFEGFDIEYLHLQKGGGGISDEVKERIIELTRQGLSQRQVADHLKISSSAVNRILKVKDAEQR